MTTQAVAAASGTFTLGGDFTVNRLGFGAMRLTGKGVWGRPPTATKRSACCGAPSNSASTSSTPRTPTARTFPSEIIREALHPYDGLVIATKAGLLRTGPDVWIPLGNPSYLRQELEMSLRRLGVETIDLFQLHRIDGNFPLEDQIGELVTLKNEGKIRHIGLSEINVDQLKAPNRSRRSSRCRTSTT